MKIISFALLLLSLSSWGTELRVGDLILQPTDCWSCSLIEDEEQSIYSHMGIVLQVVPEVLVAEALGRVRLVSLSEFDRKTEKGQGLAIYRLSHSGAAHHIQQSGEELMSLFKSDFEHLAYDHDFLWDNFDEQGSQKLYCSEMVGKLLQAFMGIESPIKRMHFSRNPEAWARYFKGNVPVGKWGNSPADFERSPLFYQVGEL
jgi:hypothetical protein